MTNYLKVINTGMLAGVVIVIVSFGVAQNVEAGFFDKFNKLLDDIDTAVDDTKADVDEGLGKVSDEVDEGRAAIDRLDKTQQNIKDAGDSLKVKAKNIEATAKGEIINLEEENNEEENITQR